MNNKELDQLLKDKLSQQTPEIKHSDWDVFSQLLKKSEGFENVDLDDKVKSSLHQHRVPYNENHWQLLKNRLLKEENLKKKLFTAKAIESILLLLVLLLFQNYDSQLFKKAMVNKISPTYAVNLQCNAAALTSQAFNTSSQQVTDTYVSHVDIMAYAFSSEAYQNTKPETILFANTVDEIQIPIPVEENSETHSAIVAIERLPIKTTKIVIFPTEEKVTSLPFVSGLLPTAEDKKPKAKFITASISGGLGIARSAYDPIYNIKGYNTYSSQYGIGLLYSVKNKKFEVQSGLRYSRKKYEPGQLRETYGSLFNGYKEIALDEISYDIVDIPLSLKYFFKEGKSLSAFIKAGVNVNFSLANKYIVQSTYTPPSSFNSFAAKLEISDGKDLDPSTKLSQKDFSPGLLQDNNSRSFLSSLGENTFFTVTGELGVEKRFSNDDAIVFGLEYNKYYKIEGMGPNKDKLSALTINLGLKHHIN